MSYTPTVWQGKPNTTTPITAVRLNKLEDGLASVATVADAASAEISALNSGDVPDGFLTALVDPATPLGSAVGVPFQFVGAPGSHPGGDAALIRAAHDRLPATGGRLQFSPGRYQIGDEQVVFTKRVTIEGAGDADLYFTRWGTVVESTSRTGHAITLAAHGSKIRDIAIRNVVARVVEDLVITNGSTTITSATAAFKAADVGKTLNAVGVPVGATIASVTNATTAVLSVAATSTRTGARSSIDNPTAGSGLRVTAGDRCVMRDISVWGFWCNIDIEDGSSWVLDSSAICNPVEIGVRMRHIDSPDEGDQSVTNNTIWSGPYNQTPRAGVMWVSGGGLKFNGNKINRFYDFEGARFRYGLELAVADDVATSVFPITGNSFENSNEALIMIHKWGTKNNGSINKIAITGNELALCRNGRAISLGNPGQPGPDAKMNLGIVIGDNSIMQCNTGIYAYNVTDILVSPNQFYDCGGGGPVYMDWKVENYQITPQLVNQVNTLVWQDGQCANPYNPQSKQAVVEHRYARDTAGSVGTGWKGLWRVTPSPLGAAGLMRFTFTAQVDGGVPTVIRQERAFSRAPNGAVTLATVGADFLSGTAMDVSWDVAAVSGEVLIQVRQNAAAGGTGTKFAKAELEMHGQIQKVFQV